MTLPCCVCNKVLDSAIGDHDPSANQPNGGLEFTSEGHYGTTFFDPMDGSLIAINICDGCLKRLDQEGKIKHYEV